MIGFAPQRLANAAGTTGSHLCTGIMGEWVIGSEPRLAGCDRPGSALRSEREMPTLQCHGMTGASSAELVPSCGPGWFHHREVT